MNDRIVLALMALGLIDRGLNPQVLPRSLELNLKNLEAIIVILEASAEDWREISDETAATLIDSIFSSTEGGAFRFIVAPVIPENDRRRFILGIDRFFQNVFERRLNLENCFGIKDSLKLRCCCIGFWSKVDFFEGTIDELPAIVWGATVESLTNTLSRDHPVCAESISRCLDVWEITQPRSAAAIYFGAGIMSFRLPGNPNV